MKKILLASFVSLSVFASIAQVDIQNYNAGAPSGPNLNGTTIYKTAGNNDLVVVDLGVTNRFGADKFLQVRRTRIVEVPAWTPTEQICWGFAYGSGLGQVIEGTCYQTNGAQTSWTSPAWNNPLPDDSIANLKFDIHTNSVDYLHYRFYIMENGVKFDSVDVVINPTLGLQSSKKDNPSISVYPNPTANFINVAGIEDVKEASVRITDVLGKVVYNESYAGKIDVADFKNGVYLVAVFSNGQMIQTRRVVIKH